VIIRNNLAQPLKKKAEAILNGLDAALQKIEAMPVTAEEKRRLTKEWLRSRLAEMLAEGTAQQDK
jgi:hypothetical protein